MLDPFFAPVAYVQIFRDRLRVSLPDRGVTVEDCGQFSHQRSILGNFAIGEQTLARALKRAYAGRWFTPRPFLVIHPQELIDGGLTQIEERALTEMGLGAGASKVKIWMGAPPTAQQLAELVRR